MPDTLKNPHPLVQQTKKIFLEHPDTYCTKLEALSINVRNLNLSRSLRIMDTFIKIMESRGHRVKIEHDGPREYKTVVYVKRETIQIRMYENGGVLTFGLNPYIDGRKNWGDGKKIKLENKLYDMVLRILLIAREQLHWSIKRRIRARKQQELDRIRAEQERLQHEEEERIQNLEKQVENWRKSCHIREYLKAAVEFVNQERGGYDEGSEFALWLKWAYAYADSISPLRL